MSGPLSSILTGAPHTDDDLPLTGLGDLLAEPDDAVDWLVENRFAYGSINLIAGKPKGGKSTLARYLAFCIATGTPFLGHRCMLGTVWYLVLEDKRSEVRRHFRALGATGAEPVRFLFGGADDLLERLALLAERERPACIIVDTMQRLVAAKDLNDYAEVTKRLDPVLLIARTTGAMVVLVHHAGKGDRAGIDSVLGSTALAGSVDNIFLVNRTDRYRLLSSIQRIGDDLPESVLILDASGRTQLGQSRHDADVVAVESAMLMVLENADAPLTQAEWLEACEGRRQLKLEALRKLVTAGTTIRTGKGGKSDPYRYHTNQVSSSQVPYKSREPESTSPVSTQTRNESAQDSGSHVPGVTPDSSGMEDGHF